jgi:hypothetical protein
MRRFLLIAAAMLAMPAAAQITPSLESLEGLYPGRAYSPYADRAFPSHVYWGDTHMHTGLSMDAGLFGNTTGVDTMLRFARGEQVTSASGQPVRLARPLDWVVTTEHSDGMGMIDDLRAGAPNVMASDQGARWSEALQAGGAASAEAALDLITTFSQGEMDPALLADYSPGSPIYASVWKGIVDTVEQYNDPGYFTAFIGYEWTSLIAGNNMHRNVIYRDGAERALLMEPLTTQPPIGSPDPMALYAWLQEYEDRTGGDVFALAHNGNLSNGIMFPSETRYDGTPVDAEYAALRARWEPLYEITQIKGDGETHPLLSPEDAFADYETWDVGNLDLSAAKTPDMLAGEYARAALKQGFGIEARDRHEPVSLRVFGRDRQPYLAVDGRRGQLFRQGDQCRAVADTGRPPVCQDGDRGIRGLAVGGLGLYRRMGDRKHPRGAVGCDGPARDLRHHRAAHDGALLWRLGLRRQRSALAHTGLPGL